jgi:hypothetical protein
VLLDAAAAGAGFGGYTKKLLAGIAVVFAAGVGVVFAAGAGLATADGNRDWPGVGAWANGLLAGIVLVWNGLTDAAGATGVTDAAGNRLLTYIDAVVAGALFTVDPALV